MSESDSFKKGFIIRMKNPRFWITLPIWIAWFIPALALDATERLIGAMCRALFCLSEWMSRQERRFWGIIEPVQKWMREGDHYDN